MFQFQKDETTGAIERAKAELDQALGYLQQMAVPDEAVRFASHALGNYLTISFGAIELLSQSLEGHPDDYVHDLLVSLRHATQLMVVTLAHMRNASIAVDEQFLSERVDLVRLMQRACDYYRHIAILKDIRIEVESDVVSPDVASDRVAVAAVLDNLLASAMEFSNPGAQVWVAVIEEPEYLVCTVRDEGDGINPEDLESLFQREVGLPSEGASASRYGLTVSKDIMDRLGGELWCESELGRGTTFYFRLAKYSEVSDPTDES